MAFKVSDHLKRPLAAHPVVSWIAFTQLFVAFLLLLLVALSLPIIKPIYILSLKSNLNNQPASVVASELRFGVWGVCADSALNEPSTTLNSNTCFGPALGYQVPDDIASLVGITPSILTIIERSLLFILILHPIAAGLSFIGFSISFFLESHIMAIINLIVAILTVILTSIVLGIDVALVVIARSKLSDLNNLHFTVEFGPAIWMVLVATVLTWAAVVTISTRACYCCGVRKYEPSDDDSDAPESD